MFVTNPETQLTGFVDELGKGFFAEAKLPGKFHVEHWLKQWGLLIRAKLGFMWLLTHLSKPVGGLGVILSPDLCDGELVLQQSFWYVAPEHRGNAINVRLLKEVEAFAKEAGVSRIITGRNLASDPQMRLHMLLESFGYRALETNYCKTICYALDN